MPDRVCEGFYHDTVTYDKGAKTEITINAKLMIDDVKIGGKKDRLVGIHCHLSMLM